MTKERRKTSQSILDRRGSKRRVGIGRFTTVRLRIVVAVVAVAACGGSMATTSSSSTSSSSSDGAGGSVFAAGASASSCGLPEGGATAGQGGAGIACMGAPPAVSYTKDIVPIFNGCQGDNCHHAAWTRTNAVHVPTTECCDGRSFIEPGDPSRSYIVNKLEGNVCIGEQMPLAPDAITPEQVKLIVAWICEGAPDN